MTAPTVFISYSHDSQEHADRVLELSNRLRSEGINCLLDQYESAPPEGWLRWMDRHIRATDFVLMICTATYFHRVMGEEAPGVGQGIRWEGNLIYQYIYNADTTNTKFIPVFFDDCTVECIPTPLRGATYYRLPQQYEDLYRHLTNQPFIQKPELGTLRQLPPRERRPDYQDNKTPLQSGASPEVVLPTPKMEAAQTFNVSESTSATTRSGGADLNAGRDISIGGDIVGRDKIVAGGHIVHAEPGATVIINETPAPTPGVPSAPIAPIDVQTLRVDAAVPEQVFVDRVFDLAVAVRQLASPLLAVKDLKHVESGEVQVAAEPNAVLINLRAEVEAPDCDIVGKRSIQFHLARGKDAPPIYFQLKPRRAGELSLIVTVYQEDYALGSARISTLAAEQTTPPAGKVQLTVTSQPLGNTPLSKEERESLERQLQAMRENLRLIEERKAEYVLETDVPLQIIKEERRLRAAAIEIQAKLSQAAASDRTQQERKLDQSWNYAAIRQLLSTAFSDDELTTLCFDNFRSVYETLGSGMNKSQKIQLLLDHCERQLDTGRLLNIARQQNPAQFARFEADLYR